MDWEAILDEQLEENQSVRYEVDRSGDSKHYWDRTKPVEVDMARAAFEKAKKEGCTIYRVVKAASTEQRGDVLHSFDPQAERMTFVPPLAGG